MLLLSILFYLFACCLHVNLIRVIVHFVILNVHVTHAFVFSLGKYLYYDVAFIFNCYSLTHFVY